MYWYIFTYLLHIYLYIFITHLRKLWKHIFGFISWIMEFAGGLASWPWCVHLLYYPMHTLQCLRLWGGDTNSDHQIIPHLLGRVGPLITKALEALGFHCGSQLVSIWQRGRGRVPVSQSHSPFIEHLGEAAVAAVWIWGALSCRGSSLQASTTMQAGH